MNYKGDVLQTGEIKISTGREDEDTEMKKYVVSVVVQRNIVVYTYVDPDGDTYPRCFKVSFQQDGETIRADKRHINELMEGNNMDKFVVRVNNEESTPAKVLRDVNFQVKRGATSRTSRS